MGGKISDDKTNKLLTTLEPKKNYVCHYKNLQLYVKLGMKVDCLHRVLSFDQQPWMAPYIAMSSKLRRVMVLILHRHEHKASQESKEHF